MPKIVFLHGCYIALRSMSKVGVKVKGRAQGQRSKARSKVGVNVKFLARSHYQSKVFV